MESDLGGQLQGINLDSFLQMAQMEKSTCTLTVSHGNERGTLYVLKGELIDAQTGDLGGYEAACRIVSWEDALIEIENRCEKRKDVIDRPLMEILMEGGRLRDEREKAAPSPGTEPEKTEDGGEAPIELDAVEIEPLEMDSVEIEPLAMEEEEAPVDFLDEAPAEPETGGEDAPLELDDEEMSLDLEGDDDLLAAAAREAELPADESSQAEEMDPTQPSGDAGEPVTDSEPFEEYKDLSRPAQKIEPQEAPGEKAGLKTVAPPPPPKKLSKKMMGIAAGLVVLIAAGVYFFFIADPTKADYEKTIAEVGQQSSPEAKLQLLKSFVGRHEAGEYTQQAQMQIQRLELQVAEKDFEALSKTVGALTLDDGFAAKVKELGEAFLAKHPRGPLAQEVQQMIAEAPVRVDDMDFAKVKGAQLKGFDEKIAACNWYLEKYPQGSHREEVQQILQAMSQSFFTYLGKEVQRCDTEKNWGKCLQLCEDFFAAFRNDPRIEEVVAMKVRMQSQQDLYDLVQKVGGMGEAHAEAKAVYQTYLQENPNSVHADRIRSEIRLLDQKIQEKEDWQALAAFAGDGKRDVFERLERLESYLKNNPKGPYADEARTLLKSLQGEKQTALLRNRKEAERKRQQAVEQARKEKMRQEQQRLEGLRQKVAADVSRARGRYVVNTNGTVTDTASGLMWTLLDSHLHLGKCLNYPSAANYVKGLDTGGYRDWRLPKSGELAGIYKNRPFFPSSGASWYWSSEAYVKGYHRVANVVTARQETVYNIGQQRQDACGAVRAVRP